MNANYLSAMQNTQIELLTVKLQTPLDATNALAVSTTIDAFAAILFEAEKQINASDKLQLRIKPFAKGSFDIPIELISLGGAFLISESPFLEGITKIVKDYFGLRKFLKGFSPPESAKDGVVVNGDVTINITKPVINIFENSSVNLKLDNAAKQLLYDTAITGLEVYKGINAEEKLIEIPREELGYLKSNEQTHSLEIIKRERKSKATLIVRRPTLEGTDKWNFVFNGIHISANIIDVDWLKKVSDGTERFGAGDSLKVDLIMHQEFNPALSTFETKSYSISKVLKHEFKSKQDQLPLFPRKVSTKKTAPKKTPSNKSRKASPKKKKKNVKKQARRKKGK